MGGYLDKLNIVAYYDHDFTRIVPGGAFQAYFNPDSYSVSLDLQYCREEGFGSVGSQMRFVRTPPKSYKFDLILDGTGASGPKVDVDDEIQKFMNMTYKVYGDSHRPPYLILHWGSLVANCVLSSLDITYTLFGNNGKPLRAKLSCAFEEVINFELAQAITRLSSPDLTHTREVQEGDTLPIMCERIYGDPKRYLEVARANDLDDFRNLKPGAKIFFPPITSSTNS